MQQQLWRQQQQQGNDSHSDGGNWGDCYGGGDNGDGNGIHGEHAGWAVSVLVFRVMGATRACLHKGSIRRGASDSPTLTAVGLLTPSL